MKKILIITQHFPPESIGRASRVLELAKFLNKFIKVRVVAPPPSKPPMHFKKAKYLFKKENFEDIDVLRIWTFQPFTNKPNFLQRALYYFIFPFFASFFIIANSKNYSTIILSTLPKSVLLVFYIARLFRKKTVIDVGDLDYDPAVFGVHKTENSILKKIAM